MTDWHYICSVVDWGNGRWEKIICQSKKLRWETGPYSEINVVTRTRVLDDSVSRTMQYIEIVINPLTFEIISENIDKFEKNLNVEWLVKHADNRWRDGYVTMASPEFEIGPYWDPLANEYIEAHRKNAEKTVIALHKFVMNLLDIQN